MFFICCQPFPTLTTPWAFWKAVFTMSFFFFLQWHREWFLSECSTHGSEILELTMDHMLYCLRDMRGEYLSSANIHCRTMNRIIKDLKSCESLMTNLLKSFFILHSNSCSKEVFKYFHCLKWVGTMLPLKGTFLRWQKSYICTYLYKIMNF